MSSAMANGIHIGIGVDRLNARLPEGGYEVLGRGFQRAGVISRMPFGGGVAIRSRTSLRYSNGFFW